MWSLIECDWQRVLISPKFNLFSLQHESYTHKIVALVSLFYWKKMSVKQQKHFPFQSDFFYRKDNLYKEWIQLISYTWRKGTFLSKSERIWEEIVMSSIVENLFIFLFLSECAFSTGSVPQSTSNKAAKLALFWRKTWGCCRVNLPWQRWHQRWTISGLLQASQECNVPFVQPVSALCW